MAQIRGQIGIATRPQQQMALYVGPFLRSDKLSLSPLSGMQLSYTFLAQ